MEKPSWIWKETAEVLGVLGVIASLIFVALEIRQNTNAVRSTTVQDISRWSYDATALPLYNPEVVAARRAACSGSLNEDQRITLLIYYAALLRLQVNRYQQAQLGILDEELTLDLVGRGGAYINPYFVEAWASMKDQFGAGFIEFVDRELVPLSQDGCQALGF